MAPAVDMLSLLSVVDDDDDNDEPAEASAASGAGMKIDDVVGHRTVLILSAAATGVEACTSVLMTASVDGSTKQRLLSSSLS